MVIEIKKIKVSIFSPEKVLSDGKEYEKEVKDDGTIIDVLSAIDKEVFENPEKSVFPLHKGLIRCFLQLLWDPETNVIYEDCAVNAYGPNKEFMPLQEDIDINLLPDSEITLIVHAD